MFSVLLNIGSNDSGGCCSEFVLSGAFNRALPNCFDASWTPGIQYSLWGHAGSQLLG